MAKKAKAERSAEDIALEAELKRIIEGIPVPRSDFECADYIGIVGDLQRSLVRIEADMNDAVEKAKKVFRQATLLTETALTARLSAIEAYCDANRAALTEDGKVKFHRFDSGEVKWRDAPPRVTLPKRKQKVAVILAWLLEAPRNFRKFVRVVHEIDKEAMLADAALAREVPGVKIESAGEAFYVTPNETKLEALA